MLKHYGNRLVSVCLFLCVYVFHNLLLKIFIQHETNEKDWHNNEPRAHVAPACTTPHKPLRLLAFPVRNRSQLCGTRPTPQPSCTHFPLWSSPPQPLPTIHPCSLRLHLYSVASVFCVLRQRRVWVGMNPSEYEGLAQTVAATKNRVREACMTSLQE